MQVLPASHSTACSRTTLTTTLATGRVVACKRCCATQATTKQLMPGNCLPMLCTACKSAWGAMPYAMPPVQIEAHCDVPRGMDTCIWHSGTLARCLVIACQCYTLPAHLPEVLCRTPCAVHMLFCSTCCTTLCDAQCCMSAICRVMYHVEKFTAGWRNLVLFYLAM
jgi:hypothetical protein